MMHPFKNTAKPSALEDSLSNLGIPYEEHRVLLALPLVYVAWADARVEPSQASAILRLAREEFQVLPKSRQMLQGWLRERPSAGYFQEGFRLLRSLASFPDELHVSGDDLQRSLLLAASVARLGADSRGEPEAVSPAQTKALRVIAALLEVDAGTTWAEMLAALEGERQAPRAEEHDRPDSRAPARDEAAADQSPTRRLRTQARLEQDDDDLEPRSGLV